MKKDTFLFLLLLCFFTTISGYSQEPNLKHTYKWYFGYGAGLDFSSGEPVPLTDGMTETDTYEATFVISDDDGNLLFYGNHGTIWNKNHEIMQGGQNYGAIESVTQIQCIKQPGNEFLYYLFHPIDTQPASIHYSIIDINANNGLGAVISTQELVPQPATQSIGAVLHCNGTDVWIAVKEYLSPDLQTWLLTENGVEETPVISQNVVQIDY